MKTLEQLADEGELFYNFETELVKQQLYDIILESSIANRVGRQLVQVIQQKAGHTYDMILADKDSLAFRRVAEGSTIPTDVESYTKISITPAKWATNIVISAEMKEDANWDIVKRNLQQAGREAGAQEDAIIVAAFADSTTGFAASTTPSSHAFSTSGTEFAITDIVTGMRLIETQDYDPNAMLLHPKQIAELRQIDTFVEAHKVGSRITFEKGFVGQIFGMDSVISSSCTSDKVYILDTNNAGVLVIRRPLTMKTYEIPERDAIGVAVSFREAARVVRADAGVEITVS